VHAVDELERLGYVTREPDPSDRRAKLVKSTARARKAEQVAREAIADIRAAWAELIGQEEMDALDPSCARCAPRCGHSRNNAPHESRSQHQNERHTPLMLEEKRPPPARADRPSRNAICLRDTCFRDGTSNPGSGVDFPHLRGYGAPAAAGNRSGRRRRGWSRLPRIPSLFR
jgi:hypothetical protein